LGSQMFKIHLIFNHTCNGHKAGLRTQDTHLNATCSQYIHKCTYVYSQCNLKHTYEHTYICINVHKYIIVYTHKGFMCIQINGKHTYIRMYIPVEQMYQCGSGQAIAEIVHP
jgi:hypothetical protein